MSARSIKGWSRRILLIVLVSNGVAAESSVPTAREARVMALNPVADAYVTAGWPSMNFGDQFVLNAYGEDDKISYIRFDLSALEGREVQSARLRFHVRNPTHDVVEVREVGVVPWDEDRITYLNRPEVRELLVSLETADVRDWHEVDLTATICAHSGEVYTIALINTGFDPMGIDSRENRDAMPVLEVTLAP
ncbi:MAG: DNRLRE domain-containing protein [Chromatiales bacterium]|nr:DNRLRE domain-containing protein [Chromatiales bacterium]